MAQTQRGVRRQEPQRRRSMRVRILMEVTDFEWTLIQALSVDPRQTQKLLAVPRTDTKLG